MRSFGTKLKPFAEALRTSLAMLANPRQFWDEGDYAMRKNVLKLTFADRLRYSKKGGLRTPEMTLPNRVLAGLREGAIANDILAEREGFEPSMSC